MRPNCYIIAGSNGAGKTTFAREFLPNWVGCVNFINPDLIAAGLSPFAPDLALLRAGRLVLGEIRGRSERGEDFAFETTLSGRTYLKILAEVKAKGYALHMLYLWIPSPELALRRIEDRVAVGGHGVPEPDVRRRFDRTLSNLMSLYRPLLDTLHFFDNSDREPTLVFKDMYGEVTVYQETLYDHLRTGMST
ncbi:MAG: hypothetical protein KAI66_26265 [Lentisphaeria bacterium]|nr:hypothetical protein [Lentisphaeria bacterium]